MTGSTGGGVRAWRPKRHFLFLISLPEMKLDKERISRSRELQQGPLIGAPHRPRRPFLAHRSLWLLRAARSWEERSPLGVSESCRKRANGSESSHSSPHPTSAPKLQDPYLPQEQTVPVLRGEGEDLSVKIEVFFLAADTEVVEDQVGHIHPGEAGRQQRI